MRAQASFPVAAVLAQTAVVSGWSQPEVDAMLAELGSRPTGMDRRTFLKAFSLGVSGVAGAAILGDLDRTLWTPGEKAFFLPPEKPALVSGPAAVQALREIEINDWSAGDGVYRVSTAVGTCVFDASWNLLTVRGIPVSPLEAARYQSCKYQGTGYYDTDKVIKLAQELEARWALSGRKPQTKDKKARA